MADPTASSRATAPPPSEVVDVVGSEEQSRVGVRQRPRGRVRIVKRVVTEVRLVTVTVRREELVVEELPVDADSGESTEPVPSSAGGSTGAPRPVLELILSEEKVQVRAVVVPRERVRVFVDDIAGTAGASTHLAHEVIQPPTTDPLPAPPPSSSPAAP